jgi:hypothetical protein
MNKKTVEIIQYFSDSKFHFRAILAAPFSNGFKGNEPGGDRFMRKCFNQKLVVIFHFYVFSINSDNPHCNNSYLLSG